jgi:GntR family transcriptional regulator/MocR family aminotransferase
MTASQGAARLDIQVDRTSAAPPLVDQVFATLRQAILDGRVEAGARLPSWRDLAAQLGVGRGTVQAAYERLSDEGLVFSAGAAGTRAAAVQLTPPPSALEVQRPLQTLLRGFSQPCLAFQTGVPAQDAFPASLWARCLSRAARQDALGATSYPDPRGVPELRAQIASHLAIARGISCVPDQIIVTGSFRAGLALAILAVKAAGRAVWMEDPGFPLTRMCLEDMGVHPVPIPVDDRGLDVERGEALAPDAALAVVTPGQQAPTGVTLSPERRRALLDWAERSDAWIIEDDYLGELQLGHRAAPALASQDTVGRVIHIGSFSKTLKPALGLGFIVAPAPLAERFGRLAATLAPIFNPVPQLAMATMLADGHYMRHLRHMKRLYGRRLDALRQNLGEAMDLEQMAGPQVRLRLAPGVDDVAMARAGPTLGVAPTALSPWYADPHRREPGLLLSVTNLGEPQLAKACDNLRTLVGRTWS